MEQDPRSLMRGVTFSGRAGPFLLMQVGRFLLTLLTLGIHRFWWKTANRRRLWRETFIDGEPLDYRGRGTELLVGFLLAFVAVLIPLGLLGIVADFLLASGMPILGIALNILYFVVLFLLIGFAVYRARRYLLSRTAWLGIRGGMVANGLAYAGLSFRLLLLQFLTLGLATPYAASRRWNALWSDSRFGTEAFVAGVDWRSLMRPFLASLAVALLLFLPAAGALGFVLVDGSRLEELFSGDPEVVLETGQVELYAIIFGGTLLALVLATLLLPLAFVPWKSAFTRAAVAATRLGPVRFAFAATTGQWLWYLVGNAALVILTLGLGALLLPWRQWDFWTTHIRINGTLDDETVRQSQLSAPSHGDGLADALDLGGI
ncbi:MAG: DUF898 family protein [Sphingomonadaceae bacterium]